MITGLNSCNCCPFGSWEESDLYHNRRFNIGDTVVVRCKNRQKGIGKIHEVYTEPGTKGFVLVAYKGWEKDKSKIELEHVAMLAPCGIER